MNYEIDKFIFFGEMEINIVYFFKYLFICLVNLILFLGLSFVFFFK